MADLKLLEIEHELSGASCEEAFQRYDAVLATLDQRLAKELDLGLQRDAFVRAEKLKEATLVARKLLRLAVKEGKAFSSDMSSAFKH